MRSLVAALVLSIFSSPALAQSAPASFDARLAANMARGDLLYAYDQSAWHVTDAMLEAVPEQTQKLMRGYITSPDATGYRTTFFGEDGDSRFKLYSAVWTGSAITGAQTFPAADRVPLSDEENRLIAAREVATAKMDDIMVCNNARPNVAVVPGATPNDPVSVYIMTPQTRTNAFPLGGHNRVDVKDGKVISRRKFTNSCVDFEIADHRDKGKPEAMGITHLLDPIPTEIHAFSVHAARLPLYVGIGSTSVFAVEVRDGKATARQIQGK